MHQHPRLLEVLPTEILLIIYDRLGLPELLSASRTCRCWREQAVRHPTFCRDIRLAAVSPTALDLFHARINARDCNLNLEIILPTLTGTHQERFRSVVCTAVQHNLHRILYLEIEVPTAVDSDIFSALHEPAPILRTLNIKFDGNKNHPDVSSALLPSIFTSNAPQLRAIQLLNVELPTQFPDCFRRLEASTFSSFSESTRRFPLEFVACCPNLRDFVVCGRHMQLPPGFMHCDRNGLRRVLIVLDTGHQDALDAIGAAQIQDVGLGMRAGLSLSDTVTHGHFLDALQGPLDMFVAIREPGLLVEYRDTSWRNRRFCAPPATKPDAEIVAHFLRNTEMLARVDAFYTSTRLLPALNALRSLPECTLFGITIDPEHGLQGQDMPVSVPKLRRLEIFGHGHLDACAVAAFIERGLTDIPIRLTVAFKYTLDVTGALDDTRFITDEPFH